MHEVKKDTPIAGLFACGCDVGGISGRQAAQR
jgi:hypothetical protein